MKNKKRRLNYKRIFIFIVILVLLIFGVILGINYLKEQLRNPKVEKYIASINTTVDLYNTEFQIVDKIVRGTKVNEYEKKVVNKETEEIYTKIEYNEVDYLIKENQTVLTLEESVLEKEKYVRTNVTVYESFDKVDIASYIPKAVKLEIIGFDKLNNDGTIDMYKVKYEETIGYVYNKYLVDTLEDAQKNYDEEGNYLIHSEGLYDPYGVGMAGELDFYPNEKPKFENNVMPETVNALFINRVAIKSPEDYIEVANKIGTNAFVIDIIGDAGLVYESLVAKEYSMSSYNNNTMPLEEYKGYVKKFKDAGFYVIGRIVTFNDTLYGRDNKEDVIIYKSNGSLFGGQYWLTPYSRNVWEYKIKLALEAVEEMGFNEIQFDYVRFPDRTGSVNHLLDFRDKYGETKAQAVQNFLMYAADELHKKEAYISADVFGESAGKYVTGYGQYWPAISNVVDVISGMPYPDHFNAHAYGIKEIVWTVPEKLMTAWGNDVVARQKSIETPAVVRTWIQSYNAIHEPYITYDNQKIKEQIQGLYNNGLTGGVMTWSSNSNINKYASFTTAFKENYE